MRGGSWPAERHVTVDDTKPDIPDGSRPEPFIGRDLRPDLRFSHLHREPDYAANDREPPRRRSSR